MPQFDRQRLAESNHRIGTIKPAQAMTTPFRPENAVQSDEQTLGNQAMQRFAQSCPLSLPSASICPFGGVCRTCPARAQTKLTISQPGDICEQEADRVAEEVMRMPDPSVSEKSEVTGICSTPHIQRYYPECDEELQRQVEEEDEKEEEEELLQTKEIPGHSSEMNSRVEPNINTIRSGGQPLPNSVREYFEPRFGYDFNQVRIHPDAHASALTRKVNARAFTVGRDIVFGSGQYTPGTIEGRRLLAHELAHVIQQNAKDNSASKIRIMRLEEKATPSCTIGPGLPNTNCSTYLANSWWLPLAYVNNATCACSETPNEPSANCVRRFLQVRLAATPAWLKHLAATQKVYDNPVTYPQYQAFVQAFLTPRIYRDHVDAYRSCCCPSGPAIYPAWIGVTTVPLPCAGVREAIEYFGSCHGTPGAW